MYAIDATPAFGGLHVDLDPSVRYHHTAHAVIAKSHMLSFQADLTLSLLLLLQLHGKYGGFTFRIRSGCLLVETSNDLYSVPVRLA